MEIGFGEILFSAIAMMIALCSLAVILVKEPVTAAVFLILNLFMVAGLYAMMSSDFVAAIQVLVYAGAIMVLFVFVIMLLNLGPESFHADARPVLDWVFLVLTLISFLMLSVFVYLGGKETQLNSLGEFTQEVIQSSGGNTYNVGMKLFSSYLWPFELSSILILLAVIASVVIARKDHPVTDDKGGKK